MKKSILYFVAIFVGFGFFTSDVFAQDALTALMHDGQDLLVLGKIKTLNTVEGGGQLEVLFTFPQSKVSPEKVIPIKKVSTAYPDRIENGKTYLFSLESKYEYFIPALGVHEINGASFADAKLVNIDSDDDIALQWFVNSGGKDTEFAFDGGLGEIYVVRGDDRVKIYTRLTFMQKYGDYMKIAFAAIVFILIAKTFIKRYIIAMIIFSLMIVPSVSHAYTSPRIEWVKKELVKQGYEKKVVNGLFSDTRIKMLPYKSVTYKQPDWNIITKKLTSPELVQEGREYIESHSAVFARAEQDYGVPQGVLVGIIAIETHFGKNVGKYSTFNALYSRTRQWPNATWKRQAGQLIALSKYCLDSNLDCMAIKGSYAGAFGIVQFMPDSLLAYGIDGDKSGAIDLMNPEDAIPSAANYLAKHGYAENNLKAIARYYGSSVGYPNIVMKFAELVKNSKI